MHITKQQGDSNEYRHHQGEADMSAQHTPGRLVVRNLWLVPEAHAERSIGGSSDPEVDAEYYAHHIGSAEGKRNYHNNGANARRLAACWNMCEGIETESIEAGWTLIERINVYADQVGALTRERDAARRDLDEMRDARTNAATAQDNAHTELDAARALLRQILDGTTPYIAALESKWEFDAEAWATKARSYLDACDTLGEKK